MTSNALTIRTREPTKLKVASTILECLTLVAEYEPKCVKRAAAFGPFQMNIHISVTPEIAKRWVSRLAILWIVSSIPVAAMSLLFAEDRIFLGVYGAVSFCVGLVLNRATHRLATNSPAAITLIEWSFYGVTASAIAAIAYISWTTPEFHRSAPGIAFVLFLLVSTLCAFAFLRKAINSLKRNLTVNDPEE